MTTSLDRSPVVAPGTVTVRRIDTGRVSDLIAQLLIELGEDPTRDGLNGTPDRVAAWWDAFLSPSATPAATCFPETQLGSQLLVVGGMSVWSLCEHHLLPMNLRVAVGYVPGDSVVGLSKFGRIAQHFAGRLQVQERFVREITDHVTGVIGRADVAVAVRGTHLCMSMRGVRMEQARTDSLDARGRFTTDPVLSQQFLSAVSEQWRGQ